MLFKRQNYEIRGLHKYEFAENIMRKFEDVQYENGYYRFKAYSWEILMLTFEFRMLNKQNHTNVRIKHLGILDQIDYLKEDIKIIEEEIERLKRKLES